MRERVGCRPVGCWKEGVKALGCGSGWWREGKEKRVGPRR